jgi:hypothetical protein
MSAYQPSPNREKNVAFANQQLDAKITYRNGRKDSQENAARGVVVAPGVVLTAESPASLVPRSEAGRSREFVSVAGTVVIPIASENHGLR